MEIRKNESLKNYTTLHIGPIAHYIYLPETKEEVIEILKKKPLILGKGSNVLINDEIEIEDVMVLEKYAKIKRNGNDLIVESGAHLMDVCLYAYKEGLSGLEFAYGIPGSVGGAIMMNAGAYGGEIKDVVVSVETNKKEYTLEECAFDYRQSIFSKKDECILSVVFHLKEENKQLIHQKMKELIDKRIKKQPLDKYSAGSTFKRGSDFYASVLINESGLRGYCVNDAQVSEKHTGFLINNQSASYRDFMKLIEDVQKIVYKKTKKKLECEVKIINQDY